MGQTLGTFVSNFHYEDLPETEQNRVKMHLLYLLGTVFASREHGGNHLALNMAGRHAASGPSSFWLSGVKGTAADCAFVNGVLSHTGLLDDMPIHTGAIVIPAALAVAEEQGRSGAETLAAIALGYDLVQRLDKPLSDGKMLGRIVQANGFRHSWIAVFGAAVAAGYLQQLSADGIADTLALTTTLCVPGAMAWAANVTHPDAAKRLGKVGVSERYLQMAINSRQAVFAADLVKSGFSGVDSSIEGAAGLYAIYAGRAEVPLELTEGLGRLWNIAEVGIKAYPGVGYTEWAYCAERLVHDYAIPSDDIEKIEVRTPPYDGMFCLPDKGPFLNIEQALVSCPFAVATTFVFGRFDWDTIPRAVGHAAVDALAGRVETTSVTPIDGSTTRPNTEMTIWLTSGKKLTTNSSELSSPQQRLPDWETTVSRFDQLANSVPTSKREEIIEAVLTLNERPSCQSLIGLLTT